MFAFGTRTPSAPAWYNTKGAACGFGGGVQLEASQLAADGIPLTWAPQLSVVKYSITRLFRKEGVVGNIWAVRAAILEVARKGLCRFFKRVEVVPATLGDTRQ